MKAEDFSVKAQNLEQVKIVFPKTRRDDVVRYLENGGWYIERCGDSKVKGTYFALAVRVEKVHESDTLRAEVTYDMSKL